MSHVPLENLKENSLSMSRIQSKIPRTSSQRSQLTRAHFDVGQALSQMNGMEKQEEQEAQEAIAELDKQIEKLREEVSAMEVQETECFRRLRSFERQKEDLNRKLQELTELIEHAKIKTEEMLKHEKAELDLKLEQHKQKLKVVLDATVENMQDQISEAEKDEGSQELKEKIQELRNKIPVLQEELLVKQRAMGEDLRKEREKRDLELDGRLAKVREMTIAPKSELANVRSELSNVENEVSRFQLEITREESKQKSLVAKIKDTSVGDSIEDKMESLEVKKRKLEEDISEQSAKLVQLEETESVKKRHYESRCGELELERKQIRRIEHQIFELSRKRRVIARLIGSPLRYYRTVSEIPYTLLESTVSRAEPLCFEKVVASTNSSDISYVKEYELLVNGCTAGESLAVINTGTEVPDLPTTSAIARSYFQVLKKTGLPVSLFRYAFTTSGAVDTISGKITQSVLIDGKLDVSSLRKEPITSTADFDKALSKMDEYAGNPTLFGFYIGGGSSPAVLLHVNHKPGVSGTILELVESLYANMRTQTVVSVPDSDDASVRECLVRASSLRSEVTCIKSKYIV